MKAAIVTQAGQPPMYGDIDAPGAAADHVLIDVEASALSHVARGRASGAHYSSSGRFPFVAGIDGVGRRDDGTRVYFFGPKEPAGSFAQQTLVPDGHCIAIPDALDSITAAAIAIPGMSSWAALTERAKFVEGETVLINGATGTSGRLAVQIAKHLGASRIIATGRHRQTLDELTAIGADSVVSLDQDDTALHRAIEPHFREGIDVVLDYVWGASAHALLTGAARSLPDGHPMRFVQIGSIGGGTLELPGAVLRASAISLLGSGIGSVPFARLLLAIGDVLQAAVPARFAIAARSVPLSELATYWAKDEGRSRTVFTMQP
jgi:NADPH:quinone reductase-like Zn-dependent oxidoreductase